MNNCEVGVPTSREFFLQEKSELGINATEKQKVEVRFDLIKVGGKLGIEYNSSERIPKTPDEVLKDRKGDCDELSLLLFLPLQKEQGFP